MRYAKVHILCIVLLLLATFSCVEGPDFDVVPRIEFRSMSGDQLRQSGEGVDSLHIVIYFEDGDGDLGTEANSGDIELVDSRTGFSLPRSSIPMVPLLGAKNGISGELNINLSFIPGIDMCCILPNGRTCEQLDGYPQDTLYYLIRIRDRAGNWSNQVTTDPIYVRCD